MGIDCDEMVFGKSPAADVCSDGRTGDAHAEDMEKEVCLQTLPFDDHRAAFTTPLASCLVSRYYSHDTLITKRQYGVGSTTVLRLSSLAFNSYD